MFVFSDIFSFSLIIDNFDLLDRLPLALWTHRPSSQVARARWNDFDRAV
jgi:hypothetical protein